MPSEASVELEVMPVTTEENKEKKLTGTDDSLSPCMQQAIGPLRFVGLLCMLWLFLFSLDLMGGSFKVIGGCTAGNMFESISNPIAGLMVGILATVLVQSSSTSTSIVVSLVGSGILDVPAAIPVIMGANIGTSVTNTIVAMGQAHDPKQLEKAFAGATVHDMFNFMSVFVLLILEMMTGFLEAMSGEMISGIEVSDGESWEGPVKVLVAPAVKAFLNANKDVIKGVAKGKECSDFYPINATAGDYGLIKCSDGKCPLFYNEAATEEDDKIAGAVCLFISLIVMVSCLFGLVTILKSIVMNSSEKWIKKATGLNPYLAMLIGCAVTILVQSSSITTSVLTPLVGLGIVSVEQMYPLTLGANIGTTATALLASLVSDKVESVQIALVHLLFNIFGILIFFPIPWMRQWPIRAAKELGHMTLRWRGTPLAYIVIMFVIVPVVLLGVSSIFAQDAAAYDVLGAIVLVALLGWAAWTANWWFRRDGRNKLIAYLENRQRDSEVYEEVPSKWRQLVQDVEELKSLIKVSRESPQLLAADETSEKPEQKSDAYLATLADAEVLVPASPRGSCAPLPTSE